MSRPRTRDMLAVKIPLAAYFPKLPPAVHEFRFHATRRWRFDLAWPEHKIALEQEGGAFIAGRHTRGAGFLADMQKYNSAGLAGWRVFRFTPSQIRNGSAQEFMRCVFVGTQS